MRKVKWILIILALLSFSALCLKACGQSFVVFSSNGSIYTRVEQDSILRNNSEQLKDLLPSNTKRPKSLWRKTSGLYGKNEYRMSLKLDKENEINFFYFYIVEDSMYTAFRYWPKTNETVILIFTFKKPCTNCAGFTKWKYRDFKEVFTESDYVVFPKNQRIPTEVWVRIPEVSTIPWKTINNFMGVCTTIRY